MCNGLPSCGKRHNESQAELQSSSVSTLVAVAVQVVRCRRRARSAWSERGPACLVCSQRLRLVAGQPGTLCSSLVLGLNACELHAAFALLMKPDRS